MSDEIGKVDPQIQRHIEREWKLNHYDEMRVQRAALAAALIGLLCGLALRVIKT